MNYLTKNSAQAAVPGGDGHDGQRRREQLFAK
jgi:hypothetical protein